MFASIETALQSSGQTGGLVLTGAEADSSFLFAFWLVLGAALVAICVLSLLKLVPEAKPPQSQRPARASVISNPHYAQQLHAVDQDPSRLQRAAAPRVITLHAVTPGQSQHEYNVGDPLGTRGSALIRVA
jgi:hypothetical protein